MNLMFNFSRYKREISAAGAFVAILIVLAIVAPLFLVREIFAIC